METSKRDADKFVAKMVDVSIISLLLIIAAFGAFAGLFAFGIGLVFLTITQAFGVGILTFGGGCLFGLTCGCPRVLRSITKQVNREVESYLSEQLLKKYKAAHRDGKMSVEEFREAFKALKDRAPVTREATAESIV